MSWPKEELSAYEHIWGCNGNLDRFCYRLWFTTRMCVHVPTIGTHTQKYSRREKSTFLQLSADQRCTWACSHTLFVRTVISLISECLCHRSVRHEVVNRNIWLIQQTQHPHHAEKYLISQVANAYKKSLFY